MTGNPHRRSVPDRARRRAIRALAGQLGVSYSVAARLLTAEMLAQRTPVTGHDRLHLRAGTAEDQDCLFALREQRPFALRVRDTRLATDLPLGRARHLVERFPPLRRRPFQVVAHPGSDGAVDRLYDGTDRGTVLALLYAVLAHESPAILPSDAELAWVAELGEAAAVDITCAATDRAARLLLDGDRWKLWTRIDAALTAGEASDDRAVRDAATVLGREFRTVSLRRSLDGARHILDGLLVEAHGGHAPGTRVRVRTGTSRRPVGVVVGVIWSQSGPPGHYHVRPDRSATVTVPANQVVALSERPVDRRPVSI
jgi:hypothetical protein